MGGEAQFINSTQTVLTHIVFFCVPCDLEYEKDGW